MAAAGFLMVSACSGRPAAIWTEPTARIVFARLPAGTFTMGSSVMRPATRTGGPCNGLGAPGAPARERRGAQGSPQATEPACGAEPHVSLESEAGHQADERPHRVTLTRPVYMSIHEVTRRQWARVMGARPMPSDDPDGDLPVVGVNWSEVQEFLDRLNRTGDGGFRLPTEAEWEYACRAGTTSAYSVGPVLSTDAANYNGEFPLQGQAAGVNRGRTTPVGSFPPNPWGLYDMHGNVWEWTSDAYCDYASGDVDDPVGRCGGPLKVIRGGSWRFNADSARCALRYTHRPQDLGDSLGFRIVRE